MLKKDGRVLRGELAAAKSDRLLILDSESGHSSGIAVADIEMINILKSSPRECLVTGMLGGAIAGIGMGLLLKPVNIEGPRMNNYWKGGNATSNHLGVEKLQSAAIGNAARMLAGMGISLALYSRGKDYYFPSMDQAEIQQFVEYLRTRARVPDYN